MMMFKPLQRTLSYIQHKLAPAAVILMYHRISTTAVEPNWLAVTPTNFAQQMAYLRQAYHPIQLAELIDCLQKGSLPQRAVVITFDDGYRDNLTCALPQLEATGNPATIFVTTGHIDSEREPWWDELKHFLLESTQAPSYLALQIEQRAYHWSTATRAERIKVHCGLENLMRPLPSYVNDTILDQLAVWTGTYRRFHPAYHTITSAELHELARHSLIELGAHTMTHPILPTLPLDAQFNEIVGSRYRLEKMINKPVLSFAYPNGDYNEQTRQLVDAAGYRLACTTTTGCVQHGDNVFQLRRCAVNDWPLETFKRKLETFFHDYR